MQSNPKQTEEQDVLGTMKDSKAQKLKDVMRKFSRFSIVVEENANHHQTLPIHPKPQSQKSSTEPTKFDELAISARSTTVSDELSMSIWSSGEPDELLMSERYSLDDDLSARFTIPEHDEPLQLPMRQLSHTMGSCLLECSNRTEGSLSRRSDALSRQSLGSSMFTGTSIDDSFRSVGIDDSARSVKSAISSRERI